MKFIGERPFDDVFITGTILDAQGQRMSKTKMNGVDPIDVFDKFGVDATRLTLAQVGSTDIVGTRSRSSRIATSPTRSGTRRGSVYSIRKARK